MKNNILIVILFILSSMSSFAQADVSKARWISPEIKIDGNYKDWVQPLNFYDNNSGLMFAVGNDKENLYLCFIVPDELKMRKLMSAGWKFELSSREKQKKFKSELIFPGINVMNVKRSTDNFENNKNSNNLIKTYQLQITSVTCKGFRSNLSSVTLFDKDHINIGIGADSIHHIVYEIAIPLQELFVTNLIRLDELITLNVTVNALERPSSGGGYSGRPSGMGGGRAGGGMSGGMGGGRRGGGMSGGMRGERYGGEMSRSGEQGSRSSLFEKVSFKQRFTLSKN